jgi:predicted dehydrogenase
VHSLSFGIVGAGNIGWVHAEAISRIPEAKTSIVCDPVEERGRALAESCGADWVPSYEKAVIRSDVDVVSVCTPSGTHAEIAVAAAQAGKHLLVEKPMDITLARADQIIETAEMAGVKLACIFPYRSMRGSRAAKKALDAGRLGRLVLAGAHVKWHRRKEYYEGSWHGTWALDGGGALMNQSIHSIDLLLWLAGPADRVFARTATLAHRIETEDTAVAVLGFQSGALGVIQGATSCWPGDPALVKLHGDRGTIALQEGRITVWKLADAAPEEEERMVAIEDSLGSGSQDPRGFSCEMHRRQIVDLVQAIQENRSPAIDGNEARRAVEAITAIYRSVRLQSEVALPLEA